MIRRLVALALIGALISSQEAAAARLSGKAFEPAAKGERFELPARSGGLAAFEQTPATEAIEGTAPGLIDLSGVGHALHDESREPALKRPALKTLETAVAASPDKQGHPGNFSAEGAHWNAVFHGTAEAGGSDALDLGGDEKAAPPVQLALARAPRASPGATLYSTTLPVAAVAAPSGISWAWSQLAALPWWGKLAIAAPAVWGLGRLARYISKKASARLKLSREKAQRVSILAEWGTMAAVTLGFAVAWIDLDKSTAELLSVVTPVFVKILTNDYILGTFLLINHPFYIGEKIRLQLGEKNERDYIVRGVSWANMILDDAEQPSATGSYIKVRHSKFIEKAVTIYRPHTRAGALWVRKIAFSVAPGLVRAPVAPVQPLQAPPLKSLILSGASAAALVGAAVAASYFSYSWLAAAAGLAAIVPSAMFGWKLMQTIGAKRQWEPGAARALARIGIGGGAVLGVHLALGLAGIAAEKLLGALGLGFIGLIVLTLDVIKPLVSRLMLLFEGDVNVGNGVELSEKYTGTVRDLVANYVVLTLPGDPAKPGEIREQLVPYSQITSVRRAPELDAPHQPDAGHKPADMRPPGDLPESGPQR